MPVARRPRDKAQLAREVLCRGEQHGLTEGDSKRRVRASTGGGREAEELRVLKRQVGAPGTAAPVSRDQHVYVRAGLYRRALSAVERILLLAPSDLDERRDRGMILAQLGRLGEAVADTQTYLNLSPAAPDADAVREQLKKMQAKQAILN